MKDPIQVPELNTYLSDWGYKPDKKTVVNKKHKTIRYLEILEQMKDQTTLSKDHENHLNILQDLFPLNGLSSILKKMQINEELTCLEADKLAVFVDTFSTVSLHPAVVGQIVAEIAIKVNQHSHTKTCRKYHAKVSIL